MKGEIQRLKGLGIVEPLGTVKNYLDEMIVEPRRNIVHLNLFEGDNFDLIKRIHQNGHFSEFNTLENVKRVKNWTGIQKDVESVVKSCEVWKKNQGSSIIAEYSC